MASVTFSASVGGDGSTVTDDANPTTGLANGGHRTRFVPALSQVVAVAQYTITQATNATSSAATSAAAAAASATTALNAPATQATSTTSLAIGLGSKSLTLAQTGKAFVVGQYVQVVSTETPTNWMVGAVTAFNSGTGAMTVNVTVQSGSGTIASWAVAPSNPPTPDTTSLQEFTSSGTWTKPVGAKVVLVECWGAGGGGGSGRRGASNTARCGGGGGGGGAYSIKLFDAADVGDSETVTIGAGGAGGAARTTNDTNGANGSNGGNTTFGALVTAFGGGLGEGGTNTSAAGGSVANAGLFFASSTPGYTAGGSECGAQGGAASLTAVVYPGGKGEIGGAGGGAGGSIDSSNVIRAAAAGGSIGFTARNTLSYGGGAAVGANGAAVAGFVAGTGAGGGSASSSANASAGGNGGLCSGGGGGGASLNGFNSGAGGEGGNGFCRVTTW